MTVEQLIAELLKHQPKMNVAFVPDNGDDPYTEVTTFEIGPIDDNDEDGEETLLIRISD